MRINENNSFITKLSFNRVIFIFFFMFLAFLFNTMLIVYSSMLIHWEVLSDSIVTLILFSFLMEIILPCLGLKKEVQYRNSGLLKISAYIKIWNELYEYICELNSRMNKCKEVYKRKGFSSFNWYAFRFAGPIWFMISVGIFYFSEWKSLWILTVGFWGWCLLFKLQTLRESKWCSEAIQVNHRFINIKIFQFIILHSAYSYILGFFLDSLSTWGQKVFFGFLVVLGTTTIFPTWWYLQLGERTGLYPQHKWWILFDYSYAGRSKCLSSDPFPSLKSQAQSTIGVVVVLCILILLFCLAHWIGISYDDFTL